MLTALHQRSLNVNGASPSSPIDPNDDLVHFCHVAALVIIVYDHAITLDNEVEYIWSKAWSKSKILYVMARYFGDILLISVCVVFLNRDASRLLSYDQPPHLPSLLSGAIGLKFVGTGSMVTIIITQMIMQSRIKALYGNVVSNLVTIFWVMEVIAVLSLGIASLAAIDVHPVILNTTRMCNPTYLPRYAFLFWVPVIVFESFLFLLALRIAYQNYREIGTWRGASLLYVILRDNFSFFVCAFAAYIITATTWLTANPRYFTVPGSFSCSLTTIMGCRLILNLCEAYHHPPDPDATPPQSIWAVATSANMMFVSAGVGAGEHGHGQSGVQSKSAAGAMVSSWPRWRREHGRRRGNESSHIASTGASSGSGSRVFRSVGVVSMSTASGVLSSEGTEEHEMRDMHVVGYDHGCDQDGEVKMKTARMGDEEDASTTVHS